MVMDIEEEILHLMIFFSFHTPQELDLNSSIHLSLFQPLLKGIPGANSFSPLLSLLINLRGELKPARRNPTAKYKVEIETK